MSYFFLSDINKGAENEAMLDTQAPVVRDVNDSAELDHDPTFNDISQDDAVAYQLQRRDMGGRVTDGEPVSKDYTLLAGADYDALVNSTYSDKGVAAARERSGDGGRRTLRVTESISPQIYDGSSFGNDMFVAFDKGISGSNVEPAIQGAPASNMDTWRQGATGRRRARRAYVDSTGDYLDASFMARNPD